LHKEGPEPPVRNCKLHGLFAVCRQNAVVIELQGGHRRQLQRHTILILNRVVLLRWAGRMNDGAAAIILPACLDLI
jgi:hypothetical protein